MFDIILSRDAKKVLQAAQEYAQQYRTDEVLPCQLIAAMAVQKSGVCALLKSRPGYMEMPQALELEMAEISVTKEEAVKELQKTFASAQQLRKQQSAAYADTKILISEKMVVRTEEDPGTFSLERNGIPSRFII